MSINKRWDSSYQNGSILVDYPYIRRSKNVKPGSRRLCIGIDMKFEEKEKVALNIHPTRKGRLFGGRKMTIKVDNDLRCEIGFGKDFNKW